MPQPSCLSAEALNHEISDRLSAQSLPRPAYIVKAVLSYKHNYVSGDNTKIVLHFVLSACNHITVSVS